MSIQEHLDKIRNAVYGSEVRESIAKGIETAYDDASENGNANMEVKLARGKFNTLKDRLSDSDDRILKNKLYAKSKTDGLDKRIDDIITEPTDDISKEEIIDARQGKKSLGSNIHSIKDPISNYFLPELKWESGTIDDSGSDYDSSPHTIRNSEQVFFKTGTKIKLSGLYLYQIFNHSKKEWLTDGWTSGDFYFETDGNYRFIIKRTNDEDLTHKVEETGSELKITPPISLATKEYVDDKKVNITDLTLELRDEVGFIKYEAPNFNNVGWKSGFVANGVFENSDSRIVSDYIKVVPGIIIKTEDYDIADVSVNTFDEDKLFKEDFGWWFGHKTFEIKEHGYVRLNLRFIDAEKNVEENMDELISQVVFETSSAYAVTPQRRLEKLESRRGSAQIENPLNASVKAICHRGYSSEAPENTLSAYRLAKEKGFSYVETDIRRTKDGELVLCHDSTIDRTSDGEGRIDEMTLEELREHDFGSWFGEEFEGEKIPTFEEFLLLCRKLNLHPYLDLLGHWDKVFAVVKKMGMTKDVTWLCSQSEAKAILNLENKSRIGLIQIDIDENIINQAVEIQTDDNDIFVDVSRHSLTTELAEQCIMTGVPLEVWDWSNNPNNVVGLVEKGVTGITSDSINVNEVLLKSEGL